MFKKPVKVSAQNQLSGKDKKTIKSKLSDNFDEASVDKVLAMNDKIICCKISGSKMLIYNGDQYPLFADGTGKNNYFPSLYIANAFQPFIKTLILNEGVEVYIYNGANLMWPGVRSYEGLGEFQKDQVVGIRNSKGEIIAIGAMGISKKQLTDTSGVAVYILHYLGDQLWAMGSKNFPEVIVPLPIQEKKQSPQQEVPKQQPKIEETAIQSIEQKGDKKQVDDKEEKQAKPSIKKQPSNSPPKKQKSLSPQDNDSDDGADFMNLVHNKNPSKGKAIQMQKKETVKISNFEQDDSKYQKIKKKTAADVKKGKKKQQSDEQNEDIQEQEQVKDKKKGKKKTGKGKKGKKQESDDQKGQQGEGEGDEPKSAINTKLMDDYFRESMLNAIKLTKIESELPIDSGKFYMEYMLPARPEGVKLQIKDSSYKKIGKFFEDMNKKKYLQYKHPKDKKAQGAQIVQIFWQHQDIKAHVPTVKKLATKEQQQKVQNYSKAKLKLSKTVTVQTVYKPSQQLFDNIFKRPLNLMPENSEDQVTQKTKQEIYYVDQKELKQKIQRYVSKMSESKDKQIKKGQKQQKTILLNYTKHNFFRTLLKAEIQGYEQNKRKDDILQGSDDEDDKKKRKNKKKQQQGMIKVQRHYIVDKLIKKASVYHHVYDKQTGLDRFKQGEFKGIHLTAQKSNNKNITKIVGLQAFIIPKEEIDQQLHGFANTLQTKFACSVNVQNLPGKNAGKEIVVHGAFLDELQDIFVSQHQLPHKLITTQNKLDKKKKN